MNKHRPMATKRARKQARRINYRWSFDPMMVGKRWSKGKVRQ